MFAARESHRRSVDRALEQWNPIFNNPAFVGGVFRAVDARGRVFFATIGRVTRDGPESAIPLSGIVAYDSAGKKSVFKGVAEVRPVEPVDSFAGTPAELARLSGHTEAYEIRPFRNGSCRVVTPPGVGMVLDFFPRGIRNFKKLNKKLFDSASVAA